jgi:hypothetical protein
MIVSGTGCYRSVLNQCGLILNDCEQKRSDIINDCEQKKAMLSIRAVDVIDPLQLPIQNGKLQES